MTQPITTMISDAAAPSPEELGRFLSQYGAWLLGSGSTCIRVEKNINRMAHAFGMAVEITIMPRHLQVAVCRRGCDELATHLSAVRQTPTSFNIITRLSELSWAVADGRIDFDTAKQQFNQIISSDRQSKAAVLLMVALANASFCRLFGGDAAAMAIVGIATLCGYYIKAVLVERGIDIRAVFIICALVSSILGATDILFPHGSTPYIAVATSVLYLVPGIPFLNSFSDLLHRHYICAFSRFADAVILTGCLSAGLCGGMLLMKIGMF